MRAAFLALLLVAVSAASAGGDDCSPAVNVDGYLLFESGKANPSLPAGSGTVEATVPDCGDESGGPSVSARRLPGLPSTIAVIHDRHLYVAPSTLPAVAGHPLVRTGARPRRRCRPGQASFTGAAEEINGAGFAVRTGSGLRWVWVDGRTRITNKPAYQPLVAGQRLEVRATRCRPHWFADRIAFVAPILTPERFGVGPPWQFILIAALALAVTAGRLSRRRTS